MHGGGGLPYRSWDDNPEMYQIVFLLSGVFGADRFTEPVAGSVN